MVVKSDYVHREHRRYRVYCRVAIVRKNELFHGRTHELSIDGASIYSDSKILIKEPVDVFLSIPPHTPKQSEKVIEALCQMLYTVLVPNCGQFRMGMHFLGFKGNGLDLLKAHLSGRVPLPD